MIRIIVVDDHPVVRDGLRAMLGTQPDLDVVGEASNGEEAVAVAAVLRPDVVLMDLRMPGLDGVGATIRITSEVAGVNVLVLTTYDTDADILRAVEAGATGYLLKDARQEVLFAAVRAAARGETVLAPAVAARLVRRVRGAGPTALSKREIEILRLVADGATNGEAARALSIGEATVKSHLVHAFAKLGVDDRTAAVTIARQRGELQG